MTTHIHIQCHAMCFPPTHFSMTHLISAMILSDFKRLRNTDPGAVSLITFSFCLDHWHSEGKSALGSGPYTHSVWEETAKEMAQPAPKVYIVSFISLQCTPVLCSWDTL